MLIVVCFSPFPSSYQGRGEGLRVQLGPHKANIKSDASNGPSPSWFRTVSDAHCFVAFPAIPVPDMGHLSPVTSTCSCYLSAADGQAALTTGLG